MLMALLLSLATVVNFKDFVDLELTVAFYIFIFLCSGGCTWGMSCRFLHPGLNDKGTVVNLKKNLTE